MSAVNLTLAEDSRRRAHELQIALAKHMQENRKFIDPKTYDLLSQAYATIGNAEYNMGILIEGYVDAVNQIDPKK